uniref:Uncharacterized protein n=1 Tax=Aegilops tauschii TaxID=37682 RepID=M8CAI5_AEGTA
MMAWVDLLKGVLTCNVVATADAVASVSFIRLPVRMPGNQSEYISPWKIRDVICSDGSLKFVEVEDLYTQEDCAPAAPSDPDIFYDGLDSYTDDLADSLPTRPTWTGWRAVVWTRALSEKFWRKGCEAHVRDILVENPDHLALLAQLGDGSVVHDSAALINLLPNFPTLSIFGYDVVYMNSLVKANTHQAWVVAIDLRNKTVISMAPYPFSIKDISLNRYIEMIQSCQKKARPLHS